MNEGLRSRRQATKYDLLEIIRALGANPNPKASSWLLAEEARRLAGIRMQELRRLRAEIAKLDNVDGGVS